MVRVPHDYGTDTYLLTTFVGIIVKCSLFCPSCGKKYDGVIRIKFKYPIIKCSFFEFYF